MSIESIELCTGNPKDSIKFSEREKALLNLKYNIDSRTFSQLYKFVNGGII